MLGMLINTNMPWANNTWKLWVDHIMKYKDTYGFKKASLVHDNGTIASATRGFMLSPTDVQMIRQAFEDGAIGEKLTVAGKTYILKLVEPDLLIAFNGSRYYIITHSKSMHIVAMAQSRNKCDDAAIFLRRLNSRLVQKDY